VLLCVSALSVHADGKTIRIGGDWGYPPFEYIDGTGKATGFNVEIARSIAKKMGMEMDVELTTRSTARDRLASGELDAVGGMYVTAERERFFDFTLPHFTVSYGIFVRKESRIDSPADLGGKRIAVQKGDIGEEYLEGLQLGARLIIVEDWKDVFGAVVRGEADCAVAGMLQGRLAIRDRAYRIVRLVGTPLFKAEYCIAVRDGNSELLAAFNEGLGILRASGEYDTIYRRWSGDLAREPVEAGVVGILSAIAAITLTLGLSMALWSISLSSRLKLATRQLESESRHRAEVQSQLNTTLAESEKIQSEARRVTGEESAFVAYINQELRTPLQGILGATELLEKTTLDEGQSRTLSMARSSAMRLNRIVSDLLDAVGGEAGSLRIEPVEFSFGEFSTWMESSLRPYAEERGLTFRFMTEGDERRITADRNRLTQVIVNLGSNAIKYTDRGEVELILRLDEHTLRVSVKDTGPGISEDAKSRLFHPYYKTKPEGINLSGGLGLGLSIVKSIVDAMGGQVSYETHPGMGTHFEVMLPIKSAPLVNDRHSATASDETVLAASAHDASAHDASAHDAKKSGMPSTGQHSARETASGKPAISGSKDGTRGKQDLGKKQTPGRAIIAEDEAINRIYLKRVLENSGFEVTQAADGEAALAAATSGEWDLILMDVSMPRMDGLEATQRIRAFHAQHQARHVPIIALTAHAYAEDRSACTDAGMDGFLSKPFTEAALWVEVKRAVAMVEASNAEGKASENDVGQ
jgi:signal transduction histidine kinase/CheY-like chemotaxis protein